MKLILFCLLPFIFISCAGSNYIAKFNGDNVEIESSTNQDYEGELIALTEDELILMVKFKETGTYRDTKFKLCSINIDQIESVVVRGYSDKDWKTGVICTEIIPAIAIGIEGGAYSGEMGTNLALSSVLLIPGLITYLIFEASSPDPPKWSKNSEYEDIKKFNIYARLPEGITPEKLEELLRINNQKEIIKIK